MTPDHLPHLHELAPGLHAALGCNGRGVALGTVLGRVLAQWVGGVSAEALDYPVMDMRAVPFHALAPLGVRARIAGMRLMDRIEGRSVTGLRERVAVVTGGSSGIGAATVLALAAAGATVVVGYNTGVARAETLVARLPPGRHMALHMPVTDSAALARAAGAVRAALGRTDVLVNSAATTRRIPHGDLDELNDATIDLILATNVRGPFATVRAFAPLLRAAERGVVVNVSSMSATSGNGSNLIYCASKGALDTMTLSLARVLAPRVRVIGVSPGTVETGFIPGISAAEIERIGDAALKTVVTAEHVAEAVMAVVLHLPMTTGTRIVVDAGRHLG